MPRAVSLAYMIWEVVTNNRAVSYLFRTTGQVLGVAVSSTITQSLLAKHLRERIIGSEAEEVGASSISLSFDSNMK